MINKIRADYEFDSETFEVSCDFCPTETEFDVSMGWSELMDEMKNNGWKSRNINGEWKHACSLCEGKI